MIAASRLGSRAWRDRRRARASRSSRPRSALRLLGIRRGWGTALLSGVLGWGAARSSPSASPTGTGAPTASSCTCSRSGSRRRWPPRSRSTCSPVPARSRSGSGPGSSPRRDPFRALRMRIAVLRRYRELVRLVRREGFGPFLSAAGTRANAPSTHPGVRLRRVLEEAGGVYVKLGQIAATRVDLMPPEISDELAKLQNRVAARADTEAIRGCWKPSWVTPSSGCSRSSTGNRSPPRRSVRRIGRGCDRARPSS